MTPRPALLDTSVLIAREIWQPLDVTLVPEQTAICVVSVAELQAGVLSAPDTETRARRLAALDAISVVDPLPITAEAARLWATLAVRLGEKGQRADVNDLWIAAVAAANGMDIVCQSDGFDAIEAVGGPWVIRI